MAFTPKNWLDSPDTSTPLRASAIEDLETRVTDYTDDELAIYSPPTLVTALPGSPTDGQVIFFDTGTAGVIWQLRYNSAAAGSYKWQFLGGPSLTAAVATQETTASTSYAALSTAGPSVTIPLAGDYDVKIGGRMWTNSAGGVASMSYDIGGTGAVDGDRITMFGSADTGGHAWRNKRQTGLTATTVLTSKYKTSAGTGSFADRRIDIIPVRVG